MTLFAEHIRVHIEFKPVISNGAKVFVASHHFNYLLMNDATSEEQETDV